MLNKKQISFQVLFSIIVVAIFSIIVTACASQPAAQVDNSKPAAPATAVPATAVAATAAPVNTPSEKPAADVSFSKQIMPIFQNSCINCHGGEKISKGLDMKTYASTMKGSQNGAIVIAGDAATSKLIMSIQSGKMPKRGTKLTADQLQLLIDWVNAGAKDN